MVQAQDLERIARELSLRSQQLRQKIVLTKRALLDAVADIRESVHEMQSSRSRLQWLTQILESLRDARDNAKNPDDLENYLNELEDWEEEEAEELEHMQFLAQEYQEMLAHRKLLMTRLVTLGRQLIQVRQRERLLMAAALRVGAVRLSRRKEVLCTPAKQ
ncbi:hypothetical protein Poli38472_009718 [Pythium oligandrum]|uniref:Uncharacterized protein n=1 Tax=Pythium oligandrum TaxID=41045 RepID=A0A8K1CGC0_PYTOL|nr:hypothetical protein Poli38472_009718 [Pythium oligandrum]|eukprot:TMW62225.1 hypothetical protein Poli38472_009718 [Pythium oligandrum]